MIINVSHHIQFYSYLRQLLECSNSAGGWPLGAGNRQTASIVRQCVVQCMVVSFSLESRLACVVFSMV